MTFRRCVVIAILALPFMAHAAPPDTAKAADFVRNAGAELAAVVGGAASPADKQARLEPYLEKVVDQDGVARFCLGRYWQTATPDQRAEYLRLFRLQLLKGVVNRLGDYQAGAVKIVINTPVERADGIYVPTVVERSGNKPVNITWMVSVVDSGMRIEDVTAEGMSLRQTQRSDYASFLARNNGDVGALIAALKKQVGE
jgi:phospholipid transport system substrate-binding protein